MKVEVQILLTVFALIWSTVLKLGNAMKSMSYKLIIAFSICLFPLTALADSDCGDPVGVDHCESQTWSGWWPFSVFNCLDNTSCKRKAGADRAPKCYPFFGGTCKCAGKNPLKRTDQTAYSEGEVETEEGIVLNALQYWEQTQGASPKRTLERAAQ